jgi:hypothetical protein
MGKKYVYQRNKFCVPVTKAEPLEQIQFIIDAFIQKKLTFCIDGEGESWEIWRIEEDSDTDKIKKEGAPEFPKFLYVDGELVKHFEVTD